MACAVGRECDVEIDAGPGCVRYRFIPAHLVPLYSTTTKTTIEYVHTVSRSVRGL